MKKKLSGLLLAVLVVAAFVFSCNKDDDDDNNVPPAAANVTIANFAFSSKTLTITAGTTVTWKNNDTAPHTVTADDDSFDSGNMATGATFSYKFTTAGTYAYHCTYHSMMTATVIVQ